MGLDEDSQYFQYEICTLCIYIHTIACLHKAMHCVIDVHVCTIVHYVQVHNTTFTNNIHYMYMYMYNNIQHVMYSHNI